MSALSRVLVPVSVILAVWMTAGHWFFGLGGWLTWWYAPTIGLTYIGCHIWVMRRMRLTREKDYRTSRGTIVSLALSWLCAILFGFMVPNMHNGELVTLFDAAAGAEYQGLAIGLCNALGIIALALLGSAVGFSIADSRDPRPEMEEPEGPIEMVFPYQH